MHEANLQLQILELEKLRAEIARLTVSQEEVSSVFGLVIWKSFHCLTPYLLGEQIQYFR